MIKLKIKGSLLNGFKIKKNKELTKEEVFQIIEALLQLKTID
jgi:hypothetical protein